MTTQINYSLIEDEIKSIPQLNRIEFELVLNTALDTLWEVPIYSQGEQAHTTLHQIAFEIRKLCVFQHEATYSETHLAQCLDRVASVALNPLWLKP